MCSPFCFILASLKFCPNCFSWIVGLGKFVVPGTSSRSSSVTHERFFVAWRYWSYGLIYLKVGIGNEAIGPSSLIYMKYILLNFLYIIWCSLDQIICCTSICYIYDSDDSLNFTFWFQCFQNYKGSIMVGLLNRST